MDQTDPTRIAELAAFAAAQNRQFAAIELRLIAIERQQDILGRHIAAERRLAEAEAAPPEQPDAFDIDDALDIADFVAARKKALEEKKDAWA